MIYKRLFTFGCSYTLYSWPTWADILGLEFPVFNNWAVPGIGNRAIAERVAECDTYFNFNETDLVIVQWSSYYRHDWMHTQRKDTSYLSSSWKTQGSIFGNKHKSIFNQDWIKNFWDEKAYYLHTLNNICLTQGLLQSTGCQWYMSSMNDLSKVANEITLDNFGGEDQTKKNMLKTAWDIDPRLDEYKLKIWERYSDRWLDPIMNCQEQTSDLAWWFDLDKSIEEEKNYDEKWAEAHPSIDQHAIYASYVKDTIFKNPAFCNKQLKLINEFKKIKENSIYYKEFEHFVNQTNWHRTNFIYGF